jgi:hypothetical protein
MQNIPPRPHPLVSPTPWVVITEAIDDGVPDRRELRYQKGLPQRDPYVVNNQKTTEKVVQVKVGDGLNTIGVLLKAVEKRLGGGARRADATFTRTLGDRLPDIDRRFESPTGVSLG